MARLRRPTISQIRARAVRIVRYQLSTGKTDAQVAKDLGVKPKTIRKLKGGNFRSIRRSFSRNTEIQKAYEKAGPPSGKGSTRINSVSLVHPAYTRKARRVARIRDITIDERDREYRSGVYVERYYVSPENEEEQTLYEQRSTWADITSGFETESGVNVPLSISDIRMMHDSGDITDEEYQELEDLWEETYGIGESET